MKIMGVLLDLDNTLYPERSYLEGGMAAVGRYLHCTCKVDAAVAKNRLLEIVRQHGRDRVFDRYLEESGLAKHESVAALVYIYRTHSPKLALYADVMPAIREIRRLGSFLGLLTDGLASVQARKIAALDLERLFDFVICTGDLPQGCGKPSTVPYQLAIKLLGVQPENTVYIGDDDTKDFAGARQIGMHTIQVVRPGEELLRTGATRFAANCECRNLTEAVECIRNFP